jgi:hypothetical protein
MLRAADGDTPSLPKWRCAGTAWSDRVIGVISQEEHTHGQKDNQDTVGA